MLMVHGGVEAQEKAEAETSGVPVQNTVPVGPHKSPVHCGFGSEGHVTVNPQSKCTKSAALIHHTQLRPRSRETTTERLRPLSHVKRQMWDGFGGLFQDPMSRLRYGEYAGRF